MSHYYFHLSTAGELIEDEEGSDFPSLDAARTRACTSMRELLGAAIKAGTDNGVESIVIVDEQQCRVAEVTAALRVTSGAVGLV
jgi:hypothetical protein